MSKSKKSAKLKTPEHKVLIEENPALSADEKENESTLPSKKVKELKSKTIKAKNATYQTSEESTLKIEEIAPTLFVLPEVHKPKTNNGRQKKSKTKVEKTDEKPIVEATTLWDYPRQSYGKTPKGDNKFQGVTPAFIIWNLVQRYTEPGDLVVDPMAGSGTTVDVCKEEGRLVYGYDISPKHPDVIKNDARSIPLPNESVDMVFIDSPYGDNVKYSDDPENIGNISAEDDQFYDELEKVASEIYRVLKPGKVMGWLIGDQWVKKNFTPVGFKIYNRLMKYFETVDIVCVARRGQSSNTGIWAYRAKKFNFFLRGFKYLFIMRKPIPNEKKKNSKKVKWAKYK